MRNKVIKIILIFAFNLIVLGFSHNVEANSINKISMDIYVDDYGNAQVTEIWDCYVNEGTEAYHPYYNLGNSQITNLTVLDETKTYATLNTWNTSVSMETKAYKCGINKIVNGVELCWGISNYGSHIYTVKYNISNFVSELTDSQMIYWTLMPYEFSNVIGDMQIKIHTDSYIEDTIDVWGYGKYGGLCYVSNGAIYMASNGTLNSSEYMTLLAKFPLGTFNIDNKLNYDFSHYFAMAEDGAEKYKEDKQQQSITEKLSAVFDVISVIAFPIIIMVINGRMMSKNRNKNALYFGKDGKKIPKKVDYYRDIPFNGDIFKAYFIAYNYDIMNKKTDLLGAIILKWMKEGRVTTKNVLRGHIIKKEETAIVLDKQVSEFENQKELELYNMLYQASGDGILEKKEFEKWCSGRYYRILNWFDSVLKQAKEQLVQEDLIIKKQKTVLGIFNKYLYLATPELKDEALKIAGLKRYLLEYTLIKEREAIEVTLFEDYLIYAQLIGIAKQVSKEFKDLYPEMIETSHFNSYDDILFIHYCSQSAISSAINAERDEQIRAASDYSSGGGGFSSGGGGGGSFGGGGGRRRFPLKVIKM